MGDKLLKYYDFALKQGGTVLQMRLAMKTGITSNSAKTTPDTPEAVQKFQTALQELTGSAAVPRF